MTLPRAEKVAVPAQEAALYFTPTNQSVQVPAVKHQLTTCSLWLLLFFCLQIPVWWTVIQYNEERALAALAVTGNKIPLMGTDVRKYTAYFRSYPDITRISGTDFEQYLKRPLYAPIFVALNWTFAKAGLDFPQRMFAFLSLFAALCGTLICVLLRVVGWSPAQAVLGALLCSVSFSWLSIFSVAESYSLTVAVAILCLLSGQRLTRGGENRHLRAFQHAGVAGVAAWLYPPLVGAALLVLPAIRAKREWLTIVLPVFAIALIVAIAPQFMYKLGSLQAQMRYGDDYSSAYNLLSWECWRDVTATFLFFSFIAPAADFLTAPGRPDWTYVGSHWPTLTAMAAMAAGYAALMWKLWQGGFARELLGVVVWYAALLLFFIVFNPKEVLIYASLPATLIAYFAAVILGHDRGWRIAAPTRRMWSAAVLAASTAVLCGLNFTPILGAMPKPAVSVGASAPAEVSRTSSSGQ